MSSLGDSRISTNNKGADHHQNQHKPPKPPRQHRVSFELGKDDHPLLVVRKRMKAGDTRHHPSSLRTYGKSASVLMDDPEGRERLRRILDRVQTDDTLTHLLTPRGEDGVTMSPPRTPPTPGRRHDITWDQEAPMFFPLRLAGPAAPGSDDLNTPSPKRKSSDVLSSSSSTTSSPSSLQSMPSINLKPRFECPWILEKLGMPQLSDIKEEGCDDDIPIPFAPFVDSSDSNEEDEEDDQGHVDKKTKNAPAKMAPPSGKAKSSTSRSPMASASAKLAGLSLSVSAAAERSNINRRKSMNARSA